MNKHYRGNSALYAKDRERRQADLLRMKVIVTLLGILFGAIVLNVLRGDDNEASNDDRISIRTSGDDSSTSNALMDPLRETAKDSENPVLRYARGVQDLDEMDAAINQ